MMMLELGLGIVIGWIACNSLRVKRKCDEAWRKGYVAGIRASSSYLKLASAKPAASIPRRAQIWGPPPPLPSCSEERQTVASLLSLERRKN